jgi:hypothetical protein
MFQDQAPLAKTLDKPACCYCKESFASRNKLFQYIKEGYGDMPACYSCQIVFISRNSFYKYLQASLICKSPSTSNTLELQELLSTPPQTLPVALHGMLVQHLMVA